MKPSIQNQIKMLTQMDIDKYVRRGTEKVEENVKIKLIIPLLELLGYNKVRDMDFEHHVRNKRADIALMFKGKPKLIVETKDLAESLDRHVDQALDYAFKKGVDWVILTNGIEIRLYKSYMTGIPSEDRILFSTSLENLPKNFLTLSHLVSRESLQTAKKITKEAEKVRENVTAKILIKDLAECRKKLFEDLFDQFKRRYQADDKFKETIDSWAERVKMDIKDPLLIEKLCKEGAYTLINRVLFLRICEDKNYIKAKLCKDALSKWRQMIEKPSNLLDIAFREIADKFEGLYKPPLFDDINFEDIKWSEETINFVLDELGEYDFSKITKDILGRAYEQHITRKERKQLGQFYTPDFVIDYILDNTLDRLLKEKPVQKIKILDPACGSGGFLMNAYDRLRSKYKQEGWADEVIHKEILKNNLYGIDINPFATQLTVMNLLLKDLDHPTGDVNVVEGDALEKLENSLDLDIYWKDSPLKKVTGINKKLSQGKLLRNAPFHVVVANPPYIRPHKISAQTKKRLWDDYETYRKKADIYTCFIERGIELLDNGGLLGFITSNTWLTIDSFAKLRKYILDNCKVLSLVTIPSRVFEEATVNTVIFLFQKEKSKQNRDENKVVVSKLFPRNADRFAVEKIRQIPQKYFTSSYQNIFDISWTKDKEYLIKKARLESLLLKDIVTLSFGLKTGHDKMFIRKKRLSRQDKKLLRRSHFGRYSINYKGEYIWYVPEKMREHKKTARPGESKRFEQPKILVQDIGKTIIATYDDENYYIKDAIILSKKEHSLSNFFDLKYILALLNSKLLQFLYSTVFPSIQVAKNELAQLPIKSVSKGKQQKFINLVDKMLSLNKQLNDPAFAGKKKNIEKEIEKTDQEINENVYQLYEITEKEKQVVEGTV